MYKITVMINGSQHEVSADVAQLIFNLEKEINELSVKLNRATVSHTRSGLEDNPQSAMYKARRFDDL